MYSMCQSKFERMAREAKVTYKIDKLVFVNTELFEKYLETFRIVEYRNNFNRYGESNCT